MVQKRLYVFFYRHVTAFHEVPLTPLVFRHVTSRKTLTLNEKRKTKNANANAHLLTAPDDIIP